MIEALILGGSAAFAWAMWAFKDKRKVETKTVVKTEVKYIEKPAVVDPTKPRIHPFMHVYIDSKCPICGVPARADAGLRYPRACEHHLFPKCVVKEDHLHMECTICTSKFIMSPAYTKGK